MFSDLSSLLGLGGSISFGILRNDHLHKPRRVGLPRFLAADIVCAYVPLWPPGCGVPGLLANIGRWRNVSSLSLLSGLHFWFRSHEIPLSLLLNRPLSLPTLRWERPPATRMTVFFSLCQKSDGAIWEYH